MTSPGDMPFDDMAAKMEKYIAAADAQLQEAGIREARAEARRTLWFGHRLEQAD